MEEIKEGLYWVKILKDSDEIIMGVSLKYGIPTFKWNHDHEYHYHPNQVFKYRKLSC